MTLREARRVADATRRHDDGALRAALATLRRQGTGNTGQDAPRTDRLCSVLAARADATDGRAA